MLKRVTILASLAVLAGGATAVSAAKVKPYNGPMITISPASGKPHTPFSNTGKKLAPSKALHVEMDCPMFGHTKNGSWHWTAHTNKTGSFTLKERVPTPKHASSANCNVYVLNMTSKAAFYVSTSFRIR